MFAMLMDKNLSTEDILLLSDFISNQKDQIPSIDTMEHMKLLIEGRCVDDYSLIFIDSVISVYKNYHSGESDSLRIPNTDFETLCSFLFSGLGDYNRVLNYISIYYRFKYGKKMECSEAVELVEKIKTEFQNDEIFMSIIARLFLSYIIENIGLEAGREVIEILSKIVKSIPEEVKEKVEIIIWTI